MNKKLVITAFSALLLPMLAHASCDDVKSSIDQKLKAKNVSGYTLQVVDGDKADQGDGKVVGQCEGTKKIGYSKGGAASDTDKPAPASASSS